MDYDPDAFKKCKTCTAIRSDALKDARRRIETSYWKPLIDHVPDNVLIDMSIAEIHAVHHCDGQAYGDAVVFAGIAVLVKFFTRLDMVPREDMRVALGDQFSRMQTEIDETKRTAREQAQADAKRDMDELRVRVANVSAQVHLAGKRKTMHTEDVKAALDWRTGEPIPSDTIDHQNAMFGSRNTSPAITPR